MNGGNYNNGYGQQYYNSPKAGSSHLRNMSANFHPASPTPSGGGVYTQQAYPHQQQYNFTSMTPGPEAQFGGNSGLNPNTLRHQPPQRRADPIVRPESSISNATFASQVPRAPYTPFQMPTRPEVGRPPYLGQALGGWMQPYGGGYTSVNGLGSGLSSITLNGDNTCRPLPVVDEGSEACSTDHGRASVAYASPSSNSLISVNPMSSAALASQIKAGSAEDPYDRSLNRLDKPVKMIMPQLGPARFHESKMFSTPDGHDPDVTFASQSAVRRPPPSPPAPDWLNLAIQGLCKPTLDEAFDALPFTELCRAVYPSNSGVIRIKDIPYQTTRQEMVAFVGRNAQILRQPEGSPFHAIHIMMERETGKTMDCFVEFSSPNEAAWVTRQFARRVESRRTPKVGDRPVEVVFSSQDELMAELFPRAKHVRWSGGHPIVDTTPRNYYDGTPAAGFQGFLHPEELVALEKHAGLSERSPFASKSPCRVYESMITTLCKYPWGAVDYVTIKERRAIYDCLMKLLRTLIENLRRSNHRYAALEPTPGLLHELTVAALNCPGFSEKQKANIVGRLHQNGFKSMTDGRSINAPLGGSHEYSAVWPFAVLSFIPEVDDALVKYYAALFREATSSTESTSLAARKAVEAAGSDDKPMGDFKINYGESPGELSIADVAKKEYNKIEQLLKIACRTDSSQPSASAPGSIIHGFGSDDPESNSGGGSHARSIY